VCVFGSQKCAGLCGRVHSKFDHDLEYFKDFLFARLVFDDNKIKTSLGFSRYIDAA
jgi:hypothetical protein